MKVALCISGHSRSYKKTYKNQAKNLININDCDIFVFTSDQTSGKGPPPWSKKINKEVLRQDLEVLYKDELKALAIETEIPENLPKPNSGDWNWARSTQYHKNYMCNKLLKNYQKENNVKYDIVVKSRFDLSFDMKIDIQKIVDSGGFEEKYGTPFNKGSDDVLFVFGGTKGHKTDCGGTSFAGSFAFGTPKVMDIFCNIYNYSGPYKSKLIHPCDQLKIHMVKNGVRICYIDDAEMKNKTRKYHFIR